MSPPEEDLAVVDFRRMLTLALLRGGQLFTAGERLVVDRMRALEGVAASLYVRLTARKQRPWRTAQLSVPCGGDVMPAIDDLVEWGLLSRFVPWSRRLEALGVVELRALCGAMGLRRGGGREVLLGRLRERPGRLEEDVVVLCHASLLLRLFRFAQNRLHPRREQAVLARMGLVRWASYATTTGSAVFPTRRALRVWERRLRGPTNVTEWLDALEQPNTLWPPGGLDPRRRVVRDIMDAAHQLERAGDLATAQVIYGRVSRFTPPGSLAVRMARIDELQGNPRAALQRLAGSVQGAREEDRVAMDRAGRRLARRLRASWAPARPMAVADVREVDLLPSPSSRGRPRWEGHTVEDAVRNRLVNAGRQTVHAEGGLWRTIFALFFAEAYFAPIPGQLPVPCLSGPLDLSTPMFRARRTQWIEPVLGAVRRGEASGVFKAACASWWGTRLRGARYDRVAPDVLQRVVEGTPPTVLEAILTHVLDHGLRSTSGLPDLVVLPSDRSTSVPGLHPRELAPGLVFVEVKGPADSLRDEQRVWHHRLRSAGGDVQRWRVRSLGAQKPRV